jgi:hypothetical protein
VPNRFFLRIPQLDPHAAERKLSPAARTGQAQSLRQVRWRVTGKPAPPLPAKTAGKGVPEKNPLSWRREGKREGDSSPAHPSPCLGFFPRVRSATEALGAPGPTRREQHTRQARARRLKGGHTLSGKPKTDSMCEAGSRATPDGVTLEGLPTQPWKEEGGNGGVNRLAA